MKRVTNIPKGYIERIRKLERRRDVGPLRQQKDDGTRLGDGWRLDLDLGRCPWCNKEITCQHGIASPAFITEHLDGCFKKPTKRKCLQCGTLFLPVYPGADRCRKCSGLFKRNVRYYACLSCGQRYYGAYEFCGRCSRQCPDCGRWRQVSRLLPYRCLDCVSTQHCLDIVRAAEAEIERMGTNWGIHREENLCALCGIRSFGYGPRLCRHCIYPILGATLRSGSTSPLIDRWVTWLAGRVYPILD
jgi:hypothetical protein